MKHTPGPWKFGKYQPDPEKQKIIRIWGGVRGRVIADIPEGDDPERAENDARLMHAALAMYQALKLYFDNPTKLNIHKVFSDAIAQAEKEVP